MRAGCEAVDEDDCGTRAETPCPYMESRDADYGRQHGAGSGRKSSVSRHDITRARAQRACDDARTDVKYLQQPRFLQPRPGSDLVGDGLK